LAGPEKKESLEATLKKLQERSDLGPVLRRIQREGQQRALEKYLRGADAEAVENFLRCCRGIDWRHLKRHRRALEGSDSEIYRPGSVLPVDIHTRQQLQERREKDRLAGERALREGKVAAVVLAGGAGTRFFSQMDQLRRALEHPNLVQEFGAFSPFLPKGCFPISPVAGLSFYQLVLAGALEAGLRFGRLPEVIFLTSHNTHRATADYLNGCANFGFPAGGFRLIRQGRVPRLDEEGLLIAEDELGNLSLTGDGHGGVYRALIRSKVRGRSLKEHLWHEGVRLLVLQNIDNATARPFYTPRLGFHLRERALFTLSVVQKTDPEEKVGLAVKMAESGRIEVIEYNLLDPELARARRPDGSLLFDAGNTNTNLVALEAVDPEIEPILYRGKSVPSRIGRINASSFEMLSQHLTRKLPPERVRFYEVEREEFFLPTKNVLGPDSVQTTMSALSRLYAQRLRACGAEVDAEAIVDLHPACAEQQAIEELGLGAGWSIDRRARLYLCLSPGGGRRLFSGGLVLEPGSLLYIEAGLPWGEITLGPHRRLKVDPASRARFFAKGCLVVKEGVKVFIRLGQGSSLDISNEYVFRQDTELKLPPGRHLGL